MSWDYSVDIGGKTREGISGVSAENTARYDSELYAQYGGNPYAHVYREDRWTGTTVDVVTPTASGQPPMDWSQWVSSSVGAPSTTETPPIVAAPGVGGPAVITSTGTRQTADSTATAAQAAPVTHYTSGNAVKWVAAGVLVLGVAWAAGAFEK